MSYLKRIYRKRIGTRRMRRGILTMLAAGLFASPAAYASTITGADGASLIDKNATVHELYAQRVSSDLGVSRYTDFKLSEGDIANLRFHERGGGVDAANLLNLVQNRVDIGGTVNALRGGRVDGGLYFLSPDGIAVGAKGVINAGSVTAMVPSVGYFEELWRDAIATGTAINSEFYNTIQEHDPNHPFDYNADNSKGINIEGRINARGGIMLGASKIDIATGAELTSNREINFTSLVNVTDAAGGVITNAGLSGYGMTAVADDVTGDIIIKAYAEHIATDDEIKQLSDQNAVTAFANEKATTRNAEINAHGTIKGDGAVKFTAGATTSFTEGSLLNIFSQTDIVNKVLGTAGLDIASDWADKKNHSSINIGEAANIESGGDMELAATNSVNVKIVANTPAAKTGDVAKGYLPTTGVGVINIENTADIDVYGRVAAGGSMKASASASSTANLVVKAATAAPPGAGTSGDLIYAAVGVLDNETDAAVRFHAGDAITAKDFSATAKVTDSTTVSATTGAGDATSAATAIGVADVNGSADVLMERSVSAGSINIDATNSSSASQIVSNTLGAADPAVKSPFLISGSGMSDAIIDPIIKKAQDKIKTKWNEKHGEKAAAKIAGGSEGDTEGVLNKFLSGDYIKLGAAVGVFDNANTATVNVADGVSLKAENNLTINAKTDMTRLNLQVTGTANNQKASQATDAMISVGVLVGTIDNDASAIIGSGAKLSGGSVAVDGSAAMSYNVFTEELTRVKNQWVSFWNDLKAYGGLANDDAYTKELEKRIDALADVEDAVELVDELNKLRDEADAHYQEWLGVIEDTSAAYTQLKLAYTTSLSLLDPATFSNFYTRAQVSDTKAAGQGSDLDVAAGVNVHRLANRATVAVGEKTAITANSGDASLDATTATTATAITGNGGKYLETANSSGAGAGLSVSVGEITGDSLVLVGKNVTIDAAPTSYQNPANIKIDASNKMTHTGLIYGSGEADKAGLSGMVNILGGEANAVASVDDEAKLDAGYGKILVTAENDSTVTGITGGATLGNTSTYAAIGAGLTDISYDVNTYAIVADNAADHDAAEAVLTDAELAGIESDVDALIKDGTIEEDYREAEIAIRKTALENEKLAASPEKSAAQKIAAGVSLAHELAEKTLTSRSIGGDGTETLNYLDISSIGAKTTGGAKGEINAAYVDVSAVTKGMINSLAVEGTDTGARHGVFDTLNKGIGIGDTFISYLPQASGWPMGKLSKTIGGKLTSAIKKHNGESATEAVNKAASAANPGGGAATAELESAEGSAAGFHLDAAGSVALNLGDGVTAAIIDNSKVTVSNSAASDDDNLSLSAKDELFKGAWAGGASLNWYAGWRKSWERDAANVAIGGALALNSSARDVASIFRGSELIGHAGNENMAITAERFSTDAAVALGLSVIRSATTDGIEAPVAGSVSYNMADADIHALIVDSDMKDMGSIKNLATNSAIEVAGGLGAGLAVGSSSASKAGAFGASAAVSRAFDDTESGIYGGSVNATNVSLYAEKETNQVNAAVAGGVAISDKSVGFAGALAYGELADTTRAFVEGGTVLDTGTLYLGSYDYKNQNSDHREILEATGVDSAGRSYMGSEGEDAAGNNGGSMMVGAALAGEWSGKGGGGAGVVYNSMKDEITTNVEATGQSDQLDAYVTNKSTIVSAAIGASKGGRYFGGAGAVGWNDMENTTAAYFGEASNFDKGSGSMTVNGNVTNNSRVVNVAGETGISGGGASLGANIAYNFMKNTTGSYILGGNYKISGLGLTADNSSYALALGLGVGYSAEGSAFNGAVAITRGRDDTESVAGNDEGELRLDSGGSGFTVSAYDKSTKTTIAGDADIAGGKAAVGAAVAYSAIGDADERESLRAEVRNAHVDPGYHDAVIRVKDSSELVTTAVGAGISYGKNYLNGQGAAAVSEIYKDSRAALTDSYGGIDDSTMLIEALSTEKVTTSGSAAGVSASGIINASVGLAINRLDMDTAAEYSRTTDSHKYTSHAFNVNAASDASATGVGIGASVALGTSNETGSFTYNFIDNDTTASLDGVTLYNYGTGVVARSDERIANYAGAAGGSRDAALGAAVSVNEITGDTIASVKDSFIKSGSAGGAMVASDIDDGAVISSQVSGDTFNPDGLINARKSTEKKGVVVDSSATHSISSDLVSGGGSAHVALNGTFNENTISGTTGALVSDTTLRYVGSGEHDHGDVAIRAADYANIGAFEVGVSGSGTGIGAGLTQNTNNISRVTEATLTGGEVEAARDVSIDAVSRQGISNLAIAGGGTGTGVGAGANIISDNLGAKTTARLDDTKIEYGYKNDGDFTLTADNESRAYMGTYDASLTLTGMSLGLGIGLINQSGETSAAVSDAEITPYTHDKNEAASYDSTSGSASIGAKNALKSQTWLISAGFAGRGAGLAGSVADNTFDETVSVSVKNSAVRAKDIAVNASSSLDAENYGGGGAVGLVGGGVGVGVTLNSVSENVSTDIEKSTLSATGKMEVAANTERDFDQTVVTVGGGAFAGLAVNVLQTDINGTLTNSDSDLRQKIDFANNIDTFDTAEFEGLSTGDAERIGEASKVSAGYGGKSGEGVHTTVNGSTLSAGDAMSVSADEKTGIRALGGSADAAIAGVNSSKTIARVNRASDVSVDGSALSGGNVNVTAATGDGAGGIDVTGFAGNATGVSVGEVRGEANLTGDTGITVNASDINATGDLALAASDTSSVSTDVYGVGVGVITSTGINSEAVNSGAVSVSVSTAGENELSAGKNLAVSAVKENSLDAKSLGVSVTAAGATINTTRAEDTGAARVSLTGGGYSVRGEDVSFAAVHSPVMSVAIDNHGGGVMPGIISRAEADISSSASVTVDADNDFYADTLSFTSRVGDANKTTMTASLGSVAVSGLDGGGDYARADSDSSSTVTIGKQNYHGKDGGAQATALAIRAENSVSRALDIWNVDIGVLEFSAGGIVGHAEAKDSVSVSAAGGDVKSLDLTASGRTYTDNDVSGSGGGAVDAGNTARAETELSGSTRAALSGAWNVADAANIGASQTDDVDTEAFSGTGAAVDVTAVYADVTMDGSANVEIAGGATLNAKELSVSAKNEASLNKGGLYDYTAHGVIGSVLDLSDAATDISAKRSSAISIGDRATITTEGRQLYDAFTNADITGKSNGTVGSLIVIDGNAKINQTIDISDTVTIGQGATLKSSGTESTAGLSLAAHDDTSVHAEAGATTAAAASFTASSEANVAVTRNNRVDVAGSLTSARDVGLYAGADTNGQKSDFSQKVISEAYNYSLLPIADASIDDNVTEKSRVVLKSSGSVEANRDISVYAKNGSEYSDTEAKTWKWAGGTNEDVNILGSSVGITNFGQTTDNYVQIDGVMTAGKQNKTAIRVSGEAVPDGFTIRGRGDQGSITVTAMDQDGNRMEDVENGTEIGTVDYNNYLTTRWNELTERIEAYSGKTLAGDDLAAYTGYLAERNAVERQMASLGLLATETDENGHTRNIPVLGEYKVVCVRLPDLATTGGGNISVRSDNLAGTGSLTAKGSPQTTIENTSNAYFITGNVGLDTSGGDIYFGDESLGADGNDAINAKNVNPSRSASFKTINAAGSGGGESFINITNKYDGGDLDVINTATNAADKYRALMTLQIDGLVDASEGSVSIVNDSGDIVVGGGTEERDTGVYGKTVSIRALGTYYQGSMEGITNIGGDPEDVFKNFAASKEKTTEVYKDSGTARHETVSGTAAELDAAKSAAGYKAGEVYGGGGVYISASDINVNGRIRAGVNFYRAEINQADLDAAIAASKEGQFSARAATVNGKTMYKVNDGGPTTVTTYGSDSDYGYIAQVYYDPDENKLVLGSIETKGGEIYLAGRIVSTGDGELYAASGASDITITNNTSVPIEIGSVMNHNDLGIIDIIDTLKNVHTTYTFDGTSIHEHTISDYTGANPTESEATYSANGAYYNPTKGARYNWTDGTASNVVETYRSDDSKFLAFIPDGSDEDRIGFESSHEPISTTTGDGTALPDGTYISVGDASGNYMLTADNTIRTQSRSGTTDWEEWHGLNKHYYSQWTVTTGSTQSYVHSLKADNPISIRFGSFNAYPRFSVYSDNADISLTSNLHVNGWGTTGFTTGKNLYIPEEVTLNIAGELFVNANTISPIKTDANILRIFAKNGDLDIYDSADDIVIQNVQTEKGSVTLTASGNVSQQQRLGYEDTADPEVGIRGNQVTVISENGSLGLADPSYPKGRLAIAVNESDGSFIPLINLEAKGDIDAYQAEGDMRIGRVYSHEGDVTLWAAGGNLINGLPTGAEQAETGSETRAQRWADAGLIEGEGAYTKMLAANVTNRADAVRRSWDAYQAKKAYYSDAVTHDENDPNYVFYTKLNEKFSPYKSVDEYLAADSEYQAMTARQKNPGYSWTREEMLYALADDIVNKTTGSTDDDTAGASIIGKNVTLKGKAIGKEGDTETIEAAWLTSGYTNPDTGKTYADYLRDIANAEASDITVDKDAEGNLSQIVVNSRTPIGVYATGALNVDSEGSVSVAVRAQEDGGETAAIFVGTVKAADGPIRLFGKRGVYNAAGEGEVNFIGPDILIEGGNDDGANIGTEAAPVCVNQTGGVLEARANGDIFLESAGNIYLGPVYSAGGVSLCAPKGTDISQVGSLSYVNAGKSLSLIAEGSGIGSADAPVRMLANGAELNISGTPTAVYVKGVADGENDLLGIGDIDIGTRNSPAGDIDIESEGGISQESGHTIKIWGPDSKGTYSRLDIRAAKDIALAGYFDLYANESINISSTDGNLAMMGSIAWGYPDYGSLNFSAPNGLLTIGGDGVFSVARSGSTKISAGSIDFLKDLSLAEYVTLTLEATQGDVTLDGNVEMSEFASLALTAQNGNIVSNGGISRAADVYTSFNSSAKNGDVTINGYVDTGYVFAEGKNIALNGGISSGNMDVNADESLTQAATSKITVSGDNYHIRMSGGSVNLAGGIDLTGIPKSKELRSLNVDIEATEGDAVLDGADISITTGSGGKDSDLAELSVSAKGNVIQDGGSISLDSKARSRASMESEEGNVTISGTITIPPGTLSTLTLTAKNGKAEQTGGAIIMEKDSDHGLVSTITMNDVLLTSYDNVFSNYAATGILHRTASGASDRIEGDLKVYAHAGKNLQTMVRSHVSGSKELTNLDKGGALTLNAAGEDGFSRWLGWHVTAPDAGGVSHHYSDFAAGPTLTGDFLQTRGAYRGFTFADSRYGASLLMRGFSEARLADAVNRVKGAISHQLDRDFTPAPGPVFYEHQNVRLTGTDGSGYFPDFARNASPDEIYVEA